MENKINTYIHPHPGITLLPFLRTTLLPAALPVVRRLQFHFTSPHAVSIATFPPDVEAAGEHAASTESAQATTHRHVVPTVQAEKDAAGKTLPTVAAMGAQAASSSNSHTRHDAIPPLAVLLLDRSRAPETEAWVFSSVEALYLPPAASADSNSTSISPELARTARLQLLSLLSHANDIPLPATFPTGRDSTVMKLGAVHAISLALLLGWQGGDTADLKGMFGQGVAVAQPPKASNGEEDKVERDSEEGKNEGGNTDAMPLHAAETAPRAVDAGGGIVLSHTIPYVKYLIPPSLTAPVDDPPPTGLQWDMARDQDYALVIGRTHIPRTPSTLRLMPSVVLRIAGEATSEGREASEAGSWDVTTAATTFATTPGRPIGWAFLSPDASLATLHVEEDYRRRGLGKMLARRVIGLLGPHASASKPSSAPPYFAATVPNSAVQNAALHNGENSDTLQVPPERLADVRNGFPLHNRREEAWIHVDVARDNSASINVIKGIGGREGWENFWVVVGLGKAGEALGREK
jgi:GNAT superfamily N-acetyltransferase